MLGPAAVPAPVIARFHAALADPAMNQRLDTGQGADIFASSPTAIGDFPAAQAAIRGRSSASGTSAGIRAGWPPHPA
ncbi:hypothetical protein [Siccirubricoccus deserti]|uniref:Uncharacterized protein n=1 Tax=Siccirubricoccus deserti TaxID=2013562 RepID=A0A9X0UF71_9PROT|nr:hypothetical protein [Siccirubricoccus deserti]MBC4017548.1 hypothetical protein [Siccirubricoccus deserti]